MPHTKPQNALAQTNTNSDIQLLPEITAFLNTMTERAKPYPTLKSITLTLARANAEKVRHAFTLGGPEMAKTEEFTIPFSGYEIKVRLYYPSNEPELPGFFYLHGGGWVLFSLDTHDRLMREYAKRANVCVIGIEYSLAPEHKYPTQINEIMHCILWCKNRATELGIDPERFVLGGDSAGGNLSTAVCLNFIQLEKSDFIKGLILNYGAFDASIINNVADQPNQDEVLLTTDEMTWFWQHYLMDNSQATELLVSPVLAELSALPPVFMAIAEYDILHQENIAMRDKMMASGVAVEAQIYQGTIHGFLESVCYGGVADLALQDTAVWLATVLQACAVKG